MSRRFDLPKGVVAYGCELFQNGKPQLLQKIKMNNSGKQASASKEAIAAILKSISKTASEDVPPSSYPEVAIAKKTTATSLAAEKPAAAIPSTHLGAATISSTSRALMVAKEEQRLHMLRNTLQLEDQARRAMMLRNASLFHQPLLSSRSYLPPMMSSRATLSSASSGTPKKLLELALLQEAMNSQFRR
jgi:hypothetical protein